jgi:hypothetical protein
MLIYTAMRLTDGESGYDEMEIPLLHSLNVSCPNVSALQLLTRYQTISSHLSQRIGENDEGVQMDHGRDWHAWIFAESRRRVVTMARIMNMAFYMDRALRCEGLPGFALIPLPSNKVAWETDDEDVWSAEYDKCHNERYIYGLTSEGKLVRLHQTAKGIDSKEEEWPRWLASQDGFGTMVMLASQFFG